jgi:hypothetical protein
MQLKVAPWPKRLEGLPEYLARVLEAGEQGPTMDIIKLLAEDPLVFGIVDLEVAVGRNAARSAASDGSRGWDWLTTTAVWHSGPCRQHGRQGGHLLRR